jgi:hypothetical protein
MQSCSGGGEEKSAEWKYCTVHGTVRFPHHTNDSTVLEPTFLQIARHDIVIMLIGTGTQFKTLINDNGQFTLCVHTSHQRISNTKKKRTDNLVFLCQL